ncbi:MAG: hypothetical protein M3P49_01675 [Actinomycetota bacterium]|nr:hypothetical protein [Actinomycetota bacterium]
MAIRVTDVPVHRWRDVAERLFGQEEAPTVRQVAEMYAYRAWAAESEVPVGEEWSFFGGMACGVQVYAEERAITEGGPR